MKRGAKVNNPNSVDVVNGADGTNTDWLLAGALAAAKAAAAVIVAGAGNVRGVRQKSSHTDLVSATDVAAEAAARQVLAAAFPGHDIVGEEGGAGPAVPTHVDPAAPTGLAPAGPAATLTSPWRWYLDPLDGTTNFVHGVPFYGVSLACLYKGEIQVGVILDPNRDETFHAVRGGGAFVNGQPLQVTAEDNLRYALLSTGLPWDAAHDRRLNLDHLNRLARQCRNVRTLGSAALSLAYVAAGRLAAYWELGLKPWDTAAGVLLVTEAGGTVTHLDGRPFDPRELGILATNGHLQQRLLTELAGAVS